MMPFQGHFAPLFASLEDSAVDSLDNEAIASAVVMYLMLSALLVLGGIAFYLGHRAFGGVLVCGAVGLLAALASGALP